MKLSTLFWLVLVVAMGFATFAVKYQVQTLETRLAQTRRSITNGEDQIHVLKAEWAYLNQPSVLAELNKRYLSLVPVTTEQLEKTIAEIPMRPVAPPAPPADLLASATAPDAPAPVGTMAAPPTAAVTSAPIAVAAVASAAAPSAAAPPPRSLGELIAQVEGR